mmetsp:Transcript_75937/g.173877  ORF Transcript_75937/g.173877 Transcript_75937/m.173877 type:complete len:371 (+) Transcript_75937:785-1897(+)
MVHHDGEEAAHNIVPHGQGEEGVHGSGKGAIHLNGVEASGGVCVPLRTLSDHPDGHDSRSIHNDRKHQHRPENRLHRRDQPLHDHEQLLEHPQQPHEPQQPQQPDDPTDPHNPERRQPLQPRAVPLDNFHDPCIEDRCGNQDKIQQVKSAVKIGHAELGNLHNHLQQENDHPEVFQSGKEVVPELDTFGIHMDPHLDGVDNDGYSDNDLKPMLTMQRKLGLKNHKSPQGHGPLVGIHTPMRGAMLLAIDVHSQLPVHHAKPSHPVDGLPTLMRQVPVLQHTAVDEVGPVDLRPLLAGSVDAEGDAGYFGGLGKYGLDPLFGPEFGEGPGDPGLLGGVLESLHGVLGVAAVSAHFEGPFLSDLTGYLLDLI